MEVRQYRGFRYDISRSGLFDEIRLILEDYGKVFRIDRGEYGSYDEIKQSAERFIDWIINYGFNRDIVQCSEEKEQPWIRVYGMNLNKRSE